MSVSPNTLPEMLAFCRAQRDHPTQSWARLCQMFTRMGWGIPPLFGTAYAQWLGADDADKHVGGDPVDAPVGAALCFKGSSAAGHIMPAAHDFRDHTSGAFSNDLVSTGRIDKVHRGAPVTEWGHRYLGYLTAVNDYDLQLHLGTPVPKPKQVRYRAIQSAIDKMGLALQTATEQHDTADVKLLGREIADLKALYDKLRRNA